MTGFIDLIRLRLSLAVTFSALTGFCIYGERISMRLLIMATGVFLLAAGASAFNQIFEQREDSLMQRTKNRPLPMHTIKPGTASVFSILIILAGLLVLLSTGLIPAALGLLNVVLYNLIYTPLKRYTSLAVIPGSAVGAIPPLIGFTAAGDKMLTPEILLFASFMFLWQLPHFWLIIMKYRDDYDRAGFKTFSRKMTEKNIRNLIFLWVFISTVFLILVMREGIFFNRLLLALLIPFNAGFIVYFYHLLYRNTGLVSANKAAFMLVNSFGLVIMLMFIINAFL